VLRKIEAALKRVKSSIVLIAEPWSFRGHIALVRPRPSTGNINRGD
jgi:hypothetical protein